MEQEMAKTKRDDVQNRAIENFKSGLNCAECVLEALIHEGALDAPADIVGYVTGFGGGIGLMGDTCGALSAAILANGIKYGRKNPYDVPEDVRGSEIAEKHYRRYNNLAHDFKALYQSCSCQRISEPFGDWHSKDRRKNCLKLIGATAALAYDYLQIGREEGFALPYRENISGL